MAYADVAVNSPGAGQRAFSYSVPSHLPVGPGCGVWVPFGRQRLQGVVLALTEKAQVEEVRPLEGLVHPEPLLSATHLFLARWLSSYYLCPLFDALQPMLPPGFERRQRQMFSLSEKGRELSQTPLPQAQRAVLELLSRSGKVDGRLLRRTLGASAGRALSALERKGALVRSEGLMGPRVRPHAVSFLGLAVPPDEARLKATELRKAGAVRQAEVLELLAGSDSALPSLEIRLRTGASLVALRTLLARGLLASQSRVVPRDPLAGRRFSPTLPPTLTPHQEGAFQEIARALERGEPSAFLLHGVTGSGKTEVYLRALARAREMGKRAIVLVPEIALTAQTIERFWGRFPGQVAVLHSGLSLGEQHDQWWGIKEGRYLVVIGSRRAVFSPQPELGLIVLDEEHEGTYKQEEQSPRYHAREVALELGRQSGAVVLLGSATPSVETMYRALRQEYRLLELPERVPLSQDGGGPGKGRSLPQVHVVDLREELKAGNRSIFSGALRRSLEETLGRGQQAILFLNRRGAAASFQCRQCGHAVRCQRCSVPLTYHEDGRLACHQCGRKRQAPSACPACGSARIRPLGLGTQRLAEEVTRSFSAARVLRWDRDTARTPEEHEAILGAFLHQEANVLVGTQMLAKGLDMPDVTLVGVINADVGLHLPDFRAAERTFQVLAQVAGRAGRGTAPGNVVLQTYQPEHYAIRAAATQDYRAFYEQETAFRQEHGYPPYSRLARLVYLHPNAEACQREAERVGRLLSEEVRRRGLSGVRVLGPTSAFIERVRGRYRWHVLVAASDPTDLLAPISFPPGWVIDVDAGALL
ncbi:MAG: primosomal protein N' [Chloroflexi bacterium]|nr:primosomal protein N' [Chloroflexota bacterium]